CAAALGTRGRSWHDRCAGPGVPAVPAGAAVGLVMVLPRYAGQGAQGQRRVVYEADTLTRGRATVTSKPPLSLLSSVSLPLCALTMVSASDNPRPTLPVMVRAESRRENARKASARRSAGMPSP